MTWRCALPCCFAAVNVEDIWGTDRVREEVRWRDAMLPLLKTIKPSQNGEKKNFQNLYCTYEYKSNGPWFKGKQNVYLSPSLYKDCPASPAPPPSSSSPSPPPPSSPPLSPSDDLLCNITPIISQISFRWPLLESSYSFFWKHTNAPWYKYGKQIVWIQ